MRVGHQHVHAYPAGCMPYTHLLVVAGRHDVLALLVDVFTAEEINAVHLSLVDQQMFQFQPVPTVLKLPQSGGLVAARSGDQVPHPTPIVRPRKELDGRHGIAVGLTGEESDQFVAAGSRAGPDGHLARAYAGQPQLAARARADHQLHGRDGAA
eukprot:scaffold650248_cov43-Prasinocladus_malaysianus.AAC.1